MLDVIGSIKEEAAHDYFDALVISLIKKSEKEQDKKSKKEQVKELYSFFKRIRFSGKEIYNYYDESVLSEYLSKEEIADYLQNIEKESIIDIDQTLKGMPKNIRSSREDKLKQHKKTIEEEAIEANRGGSDIALSNAGKQDPHYLYSIKDFICILLKIRESNFTYENIAKPGESFSELRENQDKLLLVDPCWGDSFEQSLADTVSRITGDKDGQSIDVENPAVYQWDSMPETIVIPVIQGFHWRAVRIKINYETREADVLFDDPYGKERFADSLKNSIIKSLEGQLPRLFERHFENKEKYNLNIIAYEKTVDQQGYRENSWDCGPICLSNISDYVNKIKRSISNQDFSNDSNNLFAIKPYIQRQEKSLEQIRVEDIARYLQIAEGTTLDEESKLLILKNLQEKNMFDYKKIIKKETPLSEYSQDIGDQEIAKFISSVLNYCDLFKKDQNLLNKSELDEIYLHTFGAPKVSLQDQVMQLMLEKKELVEMLKKQQEVIASLKKLLAGKKEAEEVVGDAEDMVVENAEQGPIFDQQLDLSNDASFLPSGKMKRRRATLPSSSTVNVSSDMQIEAHSDQIESAEPSNKKQMGPK